MSAQEERPEDGADRKPGRRPRRIYRHPLAIRISHWLNLVAIIALLGSGLQILIAHPSLYWGNRSDPGRSWLSFEGRRLADGRLQGVTRLFGHDFDTTGFLGVSDGPHGQPEARGFPSWATIPGMRWLAMGRRWHFFFAWVFVLNGLFYVVYSLLSRHLFRDLLPTGRELKGIGRSVREHLSLRRLRAEAAHGYNVLQKLSYLIVAFVLGPLMLLTGLTMSPWLDSVFPLTTVFDGRQSARTIHFIVAFTLVFFVLIHVLMVLLTGPFRQLRAMVTGWFRAGEEP